MRLLFRTLFPRVGTKSIRARLRWNLNIEFSHKSIPWTELRITMTARRWQVLVHTCRADSKPHHRLAAP